MKKILLCVVPGIVLIACSKASDDDAVASLDITMANIKGSYKITAANLTANGTSVDIFNNDNFFEACDRDDLYAFSDTGTYTLVDAGITCNPDNTTAGTYAVTTSKKVQIDVDSFTVVTLTATKMVLQQPNFKNSGTIGSVTFTKQ